MLWCKYFPTWSLKVWLDARSAVSMATYTKVELFSGIGRFHLQLALRGYRLGYSGLVIVPSGDIRVFPQAKIEELCTHEKKIFYMPFNFKSMQSMYRVLWTRPLPGLAEYIPESTIGMVPFEHWELFFKLTSILQFK